ncbi:ankyrin repeat-containing domain protein [Xylaria grammica]|nr:ankyrin repeat-containing domain protein [Xylaria grammica]
MASDDWEQHKLRIVSMYLIDRQPLKHIVSYMKEHHNFDKKPNKYQCQLQTWGAKKNATKDVWSYVAYRVRKRERKGKKSKVMLYGVPIPEARLRKEIQRYTNIPTAADFGKRASSPKTPEGGLIHVRSPSVIEFDYMWPETLPWFQFEFNLRTALRQTSSLLCAFLTTFRSNTPGNRYSENQDLPSLVSKSGNSLMLHNAILQYSKLVPKNHPATDHKTETLAPTQDSYSIAIDMLKAIFFRLSNNFDILEGSYHRLDGQQLQDRFILQLVEVLSHSNPQIISGLLSDHYWTSSAIKESIYKSAIREKNYSIVSRLLKAGVDPNLRVEHHFDIDHSLRRGKLKVEMLSDNMNWRGIEIAAITTDIRLGSILLRAGANLDTLDDDEPLLGLIGLDPNTRNFDNGSKFAHILIEHGANVNPKCEHGNAKTPFPLERAIARQDNLLGGLLIEKGANEISYINHCLHRLLSGRFSIILRPFGLRSSPLLTAIVSDNGEMTRRLLEPILSQPDQATPGFIREIFLVSCLAGDAATVSELLSLGVVDLNENWEDGITPLVATAWNPDITIANMLVIAGANIGPRSGRDIDKQISVPTPIHAAAFYGNANMVRILIDRGASCNVYCMRKSGMGYYYSPSEYPPSGLSNPLHVALRSRSIEAIALLLPHSEITRGELALAINLGDQSIISELISRGADILSVGQDGTTVLEAAVKKSNIEMISHFFASGGKYRSSALYKATKLAIQTEDCFVVKFLMDYRPSGPIDSYEASCLVLASLESEWDLAYQLLGSLPSGPSQSFYGNKHGYHHMYYAPSRVNYPDYSGVGITPLCAACLSGNVSLVNTMIQQGYAFQDDDQISFWNAISIHDERSSSIISSFLSMGQPERMNLIGRQMHLLCAIKSRDIQRTRQSIELVDTLNFSIHNLDVTPLRCAVGINHRELVSMLIDAGANIDYAPGTGSPLQMAAKSGHVEIATFLMDRGADINRPAYYKYGATALQYSAIQGHLGLARILIEHGADINAPPAKNAGRTALEGAAEHGRLDMIQFLLEMGANVRDRMRINYVRSVWFAARRSHFTIAKYLKEYGLWTEEDQILYDHLGVPEKLVNFYYNEELNKWHIPWVIKRSGSTYLTGSSSGASSVAVSTHGDSSEEAEESFDGYYERPNVRHRSEPATEDWLRSLVDTFDESEGFDVIWEEDTSNHPALPSRASNSIFIEPNSPQELRDENGEAGIVEEMETDGEPEPNNYQISVESEYTAGEQQTSATGKQELELQVRSVLDTVNEPDGSTSMGVIQWSDPFFGADDPENVWDI